MKKQTNDSGWRGSPEGWLDVAYDTLIESGVEAVRIQPLAKQLRLSRTSFYWFFKDRDELLRALIERWKAKNTGNFIKQCSAYAENIVEATLNVFDCWFDRDLFDSQFEFAIRSWALQSPDVSEEISAADTARIGALADLFRRFGYDELAADVRARTIYLVQIGYISMKSNEDLALRMRRVPHYVEIFTAQTPSRRDLDRFYARRGFVPDAQVLAGTRTVAS